MLKYLELLIEALDTPELFFDRQKATKRAEEIEKQGYKAEIIKERDQYTVFKLNNN